VDPGDHQAPDVADRVSHARTNGGRVRVGVPETLHANVELVCGLRAVPTLQKQVVEHEGDVERRVAVVGNLEVDHPHPVTHENVLRRVVSVDETHAGRSHAP